MSLAFLFMLPFAIRHIKNIQKEKWKYIIFTGIVGNLIPAILFSIAQTKIESSLSGILNALSPLFTLMIAVLLFKYKIKFWQTFGLLLGFVGSIGLSFIDTKGGVGSMNVYVLLIVLATICYGISLNVIKEFLNEVSSIIITALALFSIGPLSLLILFSTDFFQKLSESPGAFQSLGFIAILGIFGTAISLVLYTHLVQMTTAVFASSVTYLIPIVAILWGLFDNEKLYSLHYAGMLLILLGIYIVNRTK